jgi:thiol-disulfide isomerase/thioredoxin
MTLATRQSMVAVALAALLGLLRPVLAQAALPEGLAAVQGKVVWLDFSASWCAPCRQSFPWMNAMQRTYGPQGLSVVAVNLDRDRAAAEKFLAAMPAEFALEFDPDGSLATLYDVEAMPSSYLIDRSGDVVARHLGFRESRRDEYEAAIRSALAQTGE